MSTLPKDNSGFSVIEAILILLTVSLIGFAGWYVWNSKKDTEATLNTTSQAASGELPSFDTTDDKLTQKYTDRKDNVTFRYPSDWKIDIQKDDTVPGGVGITLTSPSGKLVLVYSNYINGLGGGNCPDAFPCPTVQILSIIDVPGANDHKVVEKITNWAGNGDGFTPSLGLITKESIKNQAVGSTQDNDFYLLSRLGNDGGFFAYHFSPDARPENGFKTLEEAKAFLAGDEAQTAKKILQSTSVN